MIGFDERPPTSTSESGSDDPDGPSRVTLMLQSRCSPVQRNLKRIRVTSEEGRRADADEALRNRGTAHGDSDRLIILAAEPWTMAPMADLHSRNCTPQALMIKSREEARAKLRRKEYRPKAAAWLATRGGFTSRDAVFYSVASLSGLVQSTLPDGSQTFNHLIDDNWLASAVAIYLPLCGAPVFASTEAQSAYHTELERALRAGLTPVPAREAALQAVGYESPHRPDDAEAG